MNRSGHKDGIKIVPENPKEMNKARKLWKNGKYVNVDRQRGILPNSQIPKV